MEAFPDPSVLTFPFRQLLSERLRGMKLTEITDVTFIVRGSTVVLAEGVKVGSSRGTSVADHQLVSSQQSKPAYVLSPNSLNMSANTRRKEEKDVLDVESSLGISIEVLDLFVSCAP
jgi:hypothetical protein